MSNHQFLIQTFGLSFENPLLNKTTRFLFILHILTYGISLSSVVYHIDKRYTPLTPYPPNELLQGLESSPFVIFFLISFCSNKLLSPLGRISTRTRQSAQSRPSSIGPAGFRTKDFEQVVRKGLTYTHDSM